MSRIGRYRRHHPPQDFKLIPVEEFGIKRLKEQIEIAHTGLWQDRFKAVITIGCVEHSSVEKCLVYLSKWDLAKEVRRVAYEYACILGLTDNRRPLVLRKMPSIDQILDVSILAEHLREAREKMKNYEGKINIDSLYNKYKALFRREHDTISGLLASDNDTKGYLDMCCMENGIFDAAEHDCSSY